MLYLISTYPFKSESESHSVVFNSSESLQARILEWVKPFPSPGNLPNPGIESRSPTLQADSLLTEPPGNPNPPSIMRGLETLNKLDIILPIEDVAIIFKDCQGF